MKCFLCYHPETVAGTTSVLFERGHLTLTVTAVPARICPNCGEAYTDEVVTVNLLRQAEQMVNAGAKVDSCEYKSS